MGTVRHLERLSVMSVPIVLDKPRELKFDLRAIKDLEANLNGQPLGLIVQHIAQLGITAMTMALWAGLKHEDRAMTPSLATKLLESYVQERKSLTKLGTALSDAIEESGLFRGEDEGQEGNGQTTTAST